MGTLFFSVMALCAWLLLCNFRTYWQRMDVINFVFAQPDWIDLCECLETVSYERHLFTLLLLRNPRKLYPNPVRGAIP